MQVSNQTYSNSPERSCVSTLHTWSTILTMVNNPYNNPVIQNEILLSEKIYINSSKNFFAEGAVIIYKCYHL